MRNVVDLVGGTGQVKLARDKLISHEQPSLSPAHGTILTSTPRASVNSTEYYRHALESVSTERFLSAYSSREREVKLMRVIFLTAAETWSGAEVHTLYLARALQEMGHDVVIVELGRRQYAASVQPQELPCPLLHLDLGVGPAQGISLKCLGFRSWLRLFGLLSGDVAILVKGNFQFGSLALEAAARFRFRRFLVIEHMHAPLPQRTTGRYLGGLLPGLGLWWHRAKFRGYLRSILPQKIISVSQVVAATLRNDYGYPPSKVVAVHSGIDAVRFAPNPRLRDFTRKVWGIPLTSFVFGSLGRLSPMKNHGQLIDVFSRLCRCSGGRDIRLVIAGDGPLRSSLEAHTRSIGVQEMVQFVGFSRTPEELYPAFDVFCFPSTTGEALPIALLEAMSCGCVPIATSVGGVPEILHDPSVGWLIPPRDEEALFSALSATLALGTNTIQEIGTNARDRVLRGFNAIDLWPYLVKVIESATMV